MNGWWRGGRPLGLLDHVGERASTLALLPVLLVLDYDDASIG